MLVSLRDVLPCYGRVAKLLERLIAERSFDGSSLTLGSYLSCTLTVDPAANGYLVATLGSYRRRGRNRPPYLAMPAAQDKCL